MSTHRFMLSPTSSREALLACPPFPPWNLPSFIVEFTLSSSCYCSDPPFSHQGAALFPTSQSGTLDRRLCSFFFGKGGSSVLANCSLSVALRPLFPFQQTQYAQVFLLKSVPFCKFFAGLCGTNKFATSLLLCDSCSVLSSIFSFTLNSVADLTGTVFALLLFYQASMGPQTLVSTRERHG